METHGIVQTLKGSASIDPARKWLAGEGFPTDGLATCINATKWDMPTETN